MLKILKSLFQTPQFPEGALVNLLEDANPMVIAVAERVDGRVLTQTRQGVLVEWPRGELRWASPDALCQQA